MRAWLLRVTAIVLVLGLIASRAEPAAACWCTAPPPVASPSHYDAIFAGEAVVHEVGSDFAKFQVSEVWKGDVDATEIVLLLGRDTTCPSWVMEGAEYIVSSVRRDDGSPLAVPTCSVVWDGDVIQEYRDALGAGQLPGTGLVIPTRPLVPQPPGTGVAGLWDSRANTADHPIVVLLIATAFALAGTGLIATRRHLPAD